MARNKVLGLLTVLILLGGTASALEFKVAVESIMETSYYDVSYQNKTETLQVINTTVENQGSIGCNYRLKAEFGEDGTSYTRYSGPYPMWPGDARNLELKYMPTNYTGEIEGNLSVTYCGLEKDITEFEFNSTQKNIVADRVESERIKVNTTHAQVELPVEEGTLIPQEAPPFWKTSSAEIEGGKTTVNYDAPIFQKSEELTYTVLDEDNNILGSTTFKLTQPEPTLREKLIDRLPEILAGILVLSFSLNLYQARRKIIPEKVWNWIEEVELEGRDIRKN